MRPNNGSMARSITERGSHADVVAVVLVPPDELAELLPDEQADPAVMLEQIELRGAFDQAIEEVLDTLPAKGKTAIILRLGLGETHEHSWKEVGRAIGTTAMDAETIYNGCMRRLCDAMQHANCYKLMRALLDLD